MGHVMPASLQSAKQYAAFGTVERIALGRDVLEHFGCGNIQPLAVRQAKSAARGMGGTSDEVMAVNGEQRRSMRQFFWQHDDAMAGKGEIEITGFDLLGCIHSERTDDARKSFRQIRLAG